MPDAKWLDALKLPTRVIAALAAAAAILLALDSFRLLDLGAFGPLGRSLTVVVLAVAGCLTLATVVSAGYRLRFGEPWKTSELARRRALRREEREEAAAQLKAAALKHLETLSKEEIAVVANALRRGAPSFFTYMDNPAVTMLVSKRLVYTPGGMHDVDRYPFSFRDFAWDAIVARQRKFLASVQAEAAVDSALGRTRRMGPRKEAS